MGHHVLGIRRDTALRITLTFVFWLIGFLIIVPFLWMIMLSFKTPFELMKAPEKFLPETFGLDNYGKVLSAGRLNYYMFYVNSIKITAINVVGGLLTSSMAGYAFGRLKFRGRDFFFLLYLSTLMIPPQVIIIPKYIMFDWMKLIDTHWSLILPGLFSVIGTFMMKQYFMQIPFELSESARIDGAHEYRIFLQIILPLAKPALMAITILNFSWHWNDYINPLIFLRSNDLLTLPLGLNVFAEANHTHIELVSTAATLASLPMIVVFIFAQEYFIKGLVTGAVKG